MTSYELTFLLEDEQQERLSKLADQYKQFNNWDEKDLLQFALTVLADNSNSIDMMLNFLEIKLEQLKKDQDT